MARTLGFTLILTIFFGFFNISYGQTPYLDYKELTRKLKSFEKNYQDIYRLNSVGKTINNRDIWVVEIADFNNYDENGPAVFVAGNIEADHLLGSSVILNTIENLLSEYGNNQETTNLINNKILYFLPRLNPDGAEIYFNKPKVQTRYNLKEIDDDNDGFINEDPPEDLNKDGYVTILRVKDNEGKFIIHPEEKRLMKKAEPHKKEAGKYKIYKEGIDNDNDGIFNEDGPGGVNINKNFPQEYPYYETGAGEHMVSENETRAIIDFIYNHKNISVILCYSFFDNLLKPPEIKKRPQKDDIDFSELYDSSGELNIPKGMDFREVWKKFFQRKVITDYNRKDIPYYKEISEKFKQITGINSYLTDEKLKPSGNLQKWGYFQFGVVSLNTPLWIIEDTDGKEKKKNKKDYEQKLLEWTQKNYPGGFKEWQPYDHPQLGKVEIGGFVPYIHMHIDKDRLKDISEKQTEFIKYLGSILPDIKIIDAKVKKHSDNLYELKVKIVNEGYLPSALNHGIQIFSTKPTLIKLNTDADILTGNKITYIYKIEGSAKEYEFSWLIKKNKDDKITIRLESEKGGISIKTINLN